jgi:hypothetical protein
MAHPEVVVPDDELNEVAYHDSTCSIHDSSIKHKTAAGLLDGARPERRQPRRVHRAYNPVQYPGTSGDDHPRAVQQADRHSTRLGGPRPRWTVCTGVTKICGCVYRIQSGDPSAEAKKALSALVRRVLLNTAPVLNPNTIARTTKT